MNISSEAIATNIPDKSLDSELINPTMESEPSTQLIESSPDGKVELSVIMPCLNEAATVGICVEKAIQVMREHGIVGEVVVSDNGSTDGSIEIARSAGARIVHQELRGYGHALMKGFDESRGHFLLMLDSDNTYNVDDIPNFVELLGKGYDVVIGNRFKGGIMPGAMSWSHQYIGNPILSGTLNFFFKTGIGDAHCGMRACTKEAYESMQLQTGGMEFASEWVINAAKCNLKMTELPTKYLPRGGESKLNSLRDAWRHLRFMLLYSPTHLYLWPGTLLILLGFIALFVLTLGPVSIAGQRFGIHWMFFASMLAILGFQVISYGFCARVYSLSSQIDRAQDPIVNFFLRVYRLESAISIGFTVFLIGILTFSSILLLWEFVGMNSLQSIRLSILALTLSVIGIQTIFASFFISMMVIRRRGWYK